MFTILQITLALIFVGSKIINNSAFAIHSPNYFTVHVWKLSQVFRTVDLCALPCHLHLCLATQLVLPVHRTVSFDEYLLKLERQGYLDRMSICSADITSQKDGHDLSGTK
jgi:hypothetical protein